MELAKTLSEAGIRLLGHILSVSEEMCRLESTDCMMEFYQGQDNLPLSF